MNPLTSIPTAVRRVLYWSGYAIGVASQGVTIVWGAVAAASPDVDMPLWLIIASAVLGLAQTQLNLLAGSNLTPEGEVLEASIGELETVPVNIDGASIVKAIRQYERETGHRID